jgi:hypothetical protein
MLEIGGQNRLMVPNLWTEDTLCLCPVNPLKMKREEGLSAYRAVNTLHFGYKNQSLNVL